LSVPGRGPPCDAEPHAGAGRARAAPRAGMPLGGPRKAWRGRGTHRRLVWRPSPPGAGARPRTPPGIRAVQLGARADRVPGERVCCPGGERHVSQRTALRVLVTADPMLPVPPTLYGGIERVIADLVAALRRRGHAVGLLAHPDSTAQADARYAWTNDASGSWRDHAANQRTLARAARDFRPDVLHSFSRLAYLGALLPSRRAKLM